jgi:iron complex outermembrane recepter protein
MMPTRRSHNHLSCVVAAICGLLAHFPASAAEPAAPPAAQPAAAPATPAATTPEDVPSKELDELKEVVIYGTNGKLVAGLQVESELDENDIGTYGANTIGDLLSQVAPDVDNSSEGPVILINGKPANGIRSVNDLPPEAIRKLQILPPQAAGAIGESPTRRVLNVVLKPKFRQGIGNVNVRGATAGKGFSEGADGSMVSVLGNNFRNFSMNVSRIEPMLDADRHIITQPTTVPYDLTGNILPWPMTGSEIDPNLSALAGEPVNVLGVPVGIANPSLNDLVPFANTANNSDMGRYRTLIGESNRFGLNGNTSFQLPRNTSVNLNLNAGRSVSNSLTGASTALLHLPASSPWSPFSNDVGIARYLGDPLKQENKQTNANLQGNVSGQLGKWRLNLDTSYDWNRSNTVSERRVDITDLQAAVNAGTLNPFDDIPPDMLAERLSDHARLTRNGVNANLNISGTLFKMPAGNASGNLRAQWSNNRQSSTTTGTNNVSSNRKRTDKVAYGSMQLPLLGTPQSQGMGAGGELSGSARDVQGWGTLFNYGYGLNWRYGNRVNLRVGINREKVAPTPGVLSDPIVTVDDVRTYDFIRQETVLVRYITGGNPDIGLEKRDITRFSGNVRPFKDIDFTLNAEYQRMIGHDVLSSLPPVSEEVQAAFPDRYRRDVDGRLYEIDARLVAFDRSETESLRWGGNYRRTFGAPPPRQPGMPSQITINGQTVVIPAGSQTLTLPNGNMVSLSDGFEEASGPGWRLNTNFTHTWQLTNTRRAREGLPETNLLSGGTGNGNGQSRHTVQGRVGIARNGTGAQLNFNWKSTSHITAGTSSAPNDITFSSLLRFDFSSFSNLPNLLPGKPWAKGVRITFAIDNLLDAKQRVHDQDGITPLRYQPYLLNSLGRTVSLSFRKSFQGRAPSLPSMGPIIINR